MSELAFCLVCGRTHRESEEGMNSKQERQTRLIELVETHNIAISINRLRRPPNDDGRWRRALYHAVCMTVSGWEEPQKIREALKLP